MTKKMFAIIISVSLLVLSLAGVGAYLLINYLKEPEINEEKVYANLRGKEDEKAPEITVEDDYIVVYVDASEEVMLTVKYRPENEEFIEVKDFASKDDKGIITLPIRLERKEYNYKVVDFLVYYGEKEILNCPYDFIVSKKDVESEQVTPEIKELDLNIEDDIFDLMIKATYETEQVKDVLFSYELFKGEEKLDIKNIIETNPDNKEGILKLDKTKLEDGTYLLKVRAYNDFYDGKKDIEFDVAIKNEFVDFSMQVLGAYKYGDSEVKYVVNFFSVVSENLIIEEVDANLGVESFEYVRGDFDNNKGKFKHTINIVSKISDVTDEIRVKLNKIKFKINNEAVSINIDDLSLEKAVLFSKPSLEKFEILLPGYFLEDEQVLATINVSLSTSENVLLKEIHYDNGTVSNVMISFNKGKATVVEVIDKTITKFQITKIVISYNRVDLSIDIPKEFGSASYNIVRTPKLVSIKTDFKNTDERKILELTFDDYIKYFNRLSYSFENVNTNEEYSNTDVDITEISNNTIKIDVTELFSGGIETYPISFKTFGLSILTSDGTLRIIAPTGVTGKIYDLKSSGIITKISDVVLENGRMQFNIIFNEAYKMPETIKVNLTWYNELPNITVPSEIELKLEKIGDYYYADFSSIALGYKGEITINYFILDGSSYGNFIGSGQNFEII